MGGIGIWQILIVALVVLVLFGRGRISDMMGDFGKGVKSFKQGIADEDTPAAQKPSARIEGPQTPLPHEAPSHETTPTGEVMKSPLPADKTD